MSSCIPVRRSPRRLVVKHLTGRHPVHESGWTGPAKVCPFASISAYWGVLLIALVKHPVETVRVALASAEMSV